MRSNARGVLSCVPSETLEVGADLFTSKSLCSTPVAVCLHNLGLMLFAGILLGCEQEIIPKLSKVTGLPVLNEQGFVVGVISRKVGTEVLACSWWSATGPCLCNCFLQHQSMQVGRLQR
jgi:hypothetical protein